MTIGIAARLPMFALAAAMVIRASFAEDSIAACCRDIDQAYPGQVIHTNGTDYDSWNERWTVNAELLPRCIFLPTSADDVAAAVKVLASGAGNSQGACPFAVKSGGHTPWAGGNDINDGIAIVLNNINETTVSSDRSFVRLGSGVIWRDAYAITNGTGLAYPGGRCPGTGVGGLTLGGGYSWFTGTVGFVADNVLNYEIVLASGEIVNANATSHSDLFMALRGGSNNFGIVTHFDVAAFEHDQLIYGGYITVPSNTTDTALENLVNFTNDTAGFEASTGLTIEFVINGTTGEGQTFLWLVDTDSEGDHAELQPFLDMEPKILEQIATSLIIDYASSVPPVSRVLMADVTYVNDLEVVRGVQSITADLIKKYSDIPDLTWDFQYEPLPRHIRDAGTARGGNIMGLNRTQDDLIINFLMPLWNDAQYDERIYEAAESWVSSVQNYTQSLGKGHSFEFVNYAAPFQNAMAGYGEENLQFLREVSRKYDPDQVFQTAVPGGYKLSETATKRPRDYPPYDFTPLDMGLVVLS